MPDPTLIFLHRIKSKLSCQKRPLNQSPNKPPQNQQWYIPKIKHLTIQNLWFQNPMLRYQFHNLKNCIKKRIFVQWVCHPVFMRYHSTHRMTVLLTNCKIYKWKKKLPLKKTIPRIKNPLKYFCLNRYFSSTSISKNDMNFQISKLLFKLFTFIIDFYFSLFLFLLFF